MNTVIFAVAVAVAAVAAGCSGSADDAGDPTAGANTISTSASALPENLPLPVPDGGTVQESVIVVTDEGTNLYQVTVSYSANRFDELVQFYKDELASVPDAVVEEANDPDTDRSLLIISDERELLVAVTQPSTNEAQLVIFAPEDAV